MARHDDDHLMTGIYIGVGLLAAAAAGYLVWRYALSDATKRKATQAVSDAAQRVTHSVGDSAKEAVRTVRHRLEA